MKILTSIAFLAIAIVANAEPRQLIMEAGIFEDKTNFQIKLPRRLLSGPTIQFIDYFESESRNLQ